MNAPVEFRAGLYPDMSNEDYHAGPGISCTGLHLMRKNPARYWAFSPMNPNRPPAEEKDGQFAGTLCHCATLEPDQFGARYIVVPENAPAYPTARSWASKNPSIDSQRAMGWWSDFKLANPGRRFITLAEYETAMRQAESIRKLPDLAQVFARGTAEQAAYWIDPETGVLCRCKPDWEFPCSALASILCDVKTYGDASDDAFAAQVARKYYDWQDVFYSSGFAHAARRVVEGFIFIAVEDKFPWQANLLMLDERSRTHAAGQVRQTLDLYAKCLREDKWPGYTGIKEISLPNYRLYE